MQRQILEIINNQNCWSEELFGLSNEAINRWEQSNNSVKQELIEILKDISNVLFFLAAKSQEQISEDYEKLSLSVESLKDKLIEYFNINNQ